MRLMGPKVWWWGTKRWWGRTGPSSPPWLRAWGGRGIFNASQCLPDRIKNVVISTLQNQKWMLWFCMLSIHRYTRLQSTGMDLFASLQWYVCDCLVRWYTSLRYALWGHTVFARWPNCHSEPRLPTQYFTRYEIVEWFLFLPLSDSTQ